MDKQYPDLTHIESHEELALYDLIPDAVWIFDLDRHGWWWGNPAALKFWGLKSVTELVDKDLSGDTEGARQRMLQTFELAAKTGLTVDPWTTYPDGKPKTLYMRHRAVLIGPQRHRAIIAYINEQVDLGEEPTNLLLVEAMRYTTLLVTNFTVDGVPVVENPAATAAYKQVDATLDDENNCIFVARFVNPEEGRECLSQALQHKGGRWDYLMDTADGPRRHTLDIRITRHPLSGDFLLLVVEYDITPLHDALSLAEDAQKKLHRLAHYDALTGLPSLRLLQENAKLLLAQAARTGQKLTVMFIDLDGFKAINDCYGHNTGDRVLQEVAQRLLSTLRESDQVSRFGGDEFVLLQANVSDQQDAATVAQKILDQIASPFPVEGGSANIGASIGIACFPDHGEHFKSLLRAADEAMYRGKRSGKNQYLFA